MSLSYAAEKYTRAVQSMATGRGSLQQRLTDAFIYSICRVMADRDLPPGLREDHTRLCDDARRRADGTRETFGDTLRHLTNDEAHEMAERIVAMEYRIRSLYDAPARLPDGRPALQDFDAMLLAEDSGESGLRPSRN